MIVDIVDKYCTNDNNPIKNLRLKLRREKGMGMRREMEMGKEMGIFEK
jgi:hypothetical protein